MLRSALVAALAYNGAHGENQNQTCHAGSVCPAKFSASGAGCCPLDDAVCCANQQTCCPRGTVCVDSGRYLTTCVGGLANVSGLSVCKPGAPEPAPGTTKQNVLVIGDSVSIGYTPYLATHLASVADVQHAPYDHVDGGAEETAYGVQCLDYMLQSPAGVALRPQVIMFNWGLHNGPLGNSTVPGQAGLPSVYAAQLENITVRLKAAQPQAKLLFALTTPQLCDPVGDGCAVTLNGQASAIMASHGIPTIDPHAAIVEKCGAPRPDPTNACWGVESCFCPHCPGAGPGKGYDWLAQSVIAPAIRRLLEA